MVWLFSILPTLTNTKFGGLQPEDFALLALLGFCVARWMCSGFKFRISTSLAPLFRKYTWLLLVILCFAIAALRMPFFPLDDASILKSPGIFSASRYLQFAAVICGFLWLTNTLLKERRRLEQALNLYWWTGVVSCFYAVISYFFLKVSGITLLDGAYFYNEAIRARGFFNEGGPFGLYIVSVVLVGLLRRHLIGRRIGFVNFMICAIAFLLSESRAAFLEVVILGLIAFLSATSLRKRVVLLVFGAAMLCGLAIKMDVFRTLTAYVIGYQGLESRLAFAGDDTSLVMGRVAGAYIVPRMLEAHPISGIGIGNYPLMRNDPQYRGPIPDIRYAEDLPGLGILGDAAELGIPATLFLIVLLSVPYTMCKGSAPIVRVCLLFQLIAHLLGAHLTFFYPWFVSACAIAASEANPALLQEVSPLRSLARLMKRGEPSPSAT